MLDAEVVLPGRFVAGAGRGQPLVVAEVGVDRLPDPEPGYVVGAARLGAGTDRGPLPAAEGLAAHDGTGRAPVDVGVAHLHRLGPTVDLSGIQGVDAAGESVGGGVLNGDGLVERLGAHEAQHRAETLRSMEPRARPHSEAHAGGPRPGVEAAVRASDEVLDTQGWYESLSSLLASRPPVQWRDEDHLLFSNSLREVSRGFSTLEPIIFDLQEEPSEDSVHDTNSPTVKRVRLSVTMQYEDEHEQVVSIHPEDRKLIEQLCQRLQSEIAKEDVTLETKIAAVAQLSNQLLIQRKAIRKSHE